MYYPKSQITTGLNTNGDEFVYRDSNKEYRGAYWKTSTNKYYTGKGPTDPQSRELVFLALKETAKSNIIPQEDLNNQTFITEQALDYYNIMAQMPKAINIRTPNLPIGTVNIPTDNDYRIGEYRRFFCKKINEELYLEIDQTTFNKLTSRDSSILWQYYVAFNIPWTLVGDMKQVYMANKNVTQLIAERNNAKNLAQFLKNDYLKYYKG